MKSKPILNKNKKASELTMTIIIVAVLALIVLVVMAFIFGGKMKDTSAGLKSCTALGGACTGSVTEVVEGKTTKFTCANGAAVQNTDCGTSSGCCIELS